MHLVKTQIHSSRRRLAHTMRDKRVSSRISVSGALSIRHDARPAHVANDRRPMLVGATAADVEQEVIRSGDPLVGCGQDEPSGAFTSTATESLKRHWLGFSNQI